MKRLFVLLLYFSIFFVLTILTQIGGVIFLFSLWITKRISQFRRLKRLVIFVVLYLLATFIVVPVIAPFFGREPVKNDKIIHATSFITTLFNRNYVRPQLNILLSNVADRLQATPVEIHYLDANFPFINKFPLLPHLSHNDGKKIDLSLIYETKEGKISTLQKSVSGYGVFEEPRQGEYNQIAFCKSKGYFQYDYPKYLSFGTKNANLLFSEKGTKMLINSILKEKLLGKMFIEPHLKKRLNLTDKRIRYHGCRAVRHDDHIHIQLK